MKEPWRDRDASGCLPIPSAEDRDRFAHQALGVTTELTAPQVEEIVRIALAHSMMLEIRPSNVGHLWHLWWNEDRFQRGVYIRVERRPAAENAALAISPYIRWNQTRDDGYVEAWHGQGTWVELAIEDPLPLRDAVDKARTAASKMTTADLRPPPANV